MRSSMRVSKAMALAGLACCASSASSASSPRAPPIRPAPRHAHDQIGAFARIQCQAPQRIGGDSGPLITHGEPHVRLFVEAVCTRLQSKRDVFFDALILHVRPAGQRLLVLADALLRMPRSMIMLSTAFLLRSRTVYRLWTATLHRRPCKPDEACGSVHRSGSSPSRRRSQPHFRFGWLGPRPSLEGQRQRRDRRIIEDCAGDNDDRTKPKIPVHQRADR